jgi:hypothetical protein
MEQTEAPVLRTEGGGALSGEQAEHGLLAATVGPRRRAS